MKKIINGRMYNTETAKNLGTYWNGYNSTDFRSYSETLYLKRNGEYFLHGEGGPMSKYKEYIGETIYSGEKITPLTKAEAESWAEPKLTAEEYEEIFGTVEE